MPITVGGMYFGHSQQLSNITYGFGCAVLSLSFRVVSKRVNHDGTVQRHCFVRSNRFTGRFLVATVRRILARDNATRPRRTKEPILLSKLREEFIIGERSGNVAHVKQNLIKMGASPLRIVFCGHGSGIKMVTIVEMMIVVVAIPEINIHVSQGWAVRERVDAGSLVSLAFVVTTTIDHASPASIVNVGSFALAIHTYLDTFLKLFHGE
mmetsp:Transcript_24072/g.35490  ORF Transcript_24072/g.35490 Transcript_24072/m.35490 type:complete len:209 (-) Transcript_24072:1954-2580(-)